MDSVPRTVTDAGSTVKKHDESPPIDDTNGIVTGSTTSSVTVSTCAIGSDVVFSQPNGNGQAYATDFRKASHPDKNSSHQSTRSYCWSQTPVSATKRPGNLNVYGRLPNYTQSHASRPTFKVPSLIYINSLRNAKALFCVFCPDNLRLKALFFMPYKGKQASGQFTKHTNQKTSYVPYSGNYGNGKANSSFLDCRDEYRKTERNGYGNGNANSGFLDHRDEYRKPERNGYGNGHANSGFLDPRDEYRKLERNGYGNGNANGGFLDHRDEYKKPERNGESDSLVEMKCGPRTSAKTHPPPESSSLKQNNSFVLDLRKEMFNLPDFQTDYEDAKFFVIKSYSEDDVHKSIKYSVWSSTVNGNKKLDAAFRDAEAKTLVDGKKRPVFLFFSVNASRQFVGLAEMVGYVDLNKDLDFWQVDKWCGFFPVEWHVVKDVPNWDLCHIVLDNNEGKPVTHTRDTQEIKLKEGLQMLSIFKNYSAVTSLLDDMDFYEEREKSLRLKKEHKPATLRMDLFKEKDYNYENGGNRRMNQDRGYNWNRSSSSRQQQSLVSLTKNLSIRGGYSVAKKNKSYS